MNIDVISILGKSRYEHITSMLHTISCLPDLRDIEFEITLKDISLLTSLELVKIEYNDCILYDIINDVGIAYRYYPESSMIERKIVLQKNDISDTCFPLVFRYSKEDIAQVADTSFLNEVNKYSRKQRITYKSMDPKLADWKIEKTVRFYAEDSRSRKLIENLTEDNVNTESLYDVVDVEFEYIGEPKYIVQSVSVLLSRLFPAMFKYVNITYGKINAILKSDIAHLSQKVAIITQSMIDNTDIKSYSISEKIDGERAILIVFGDNIYVQTSTSFTEISCNDDVNESMFNSKRKRTLIILDCEYLNDIYYIFDVLYNNGKVSTSFQERSILIESFVLEYENRIPIKRLPSFSLRTWDAAINYINDNETSKIFKNIPIDGIILRDGNSLYKLKNKAHLTVDFLIRYNRDDGYCYLFTIGDPKEVITKKPFNEPYSKGLFGYHLNEKINTTSAYILADFPYISSCFRTVIDDYEKYDGKITEMLLSDDKTWVPIRIRYDKEYPNGYKIAMSLYGLMENGIHSTYSLSQNTNDNKNMILKRLYPTFINTYVKSLVLSNDVNIADVFMNYHATLDMFYIVSEQGTVINESLNKLLLAKTFYNKDIKGILFNGYHSLFNNLLSISEGFYQHSLNHVIIDDIYTYAPSYIDLYALCNFLSKSVSIDGVIVMYFDLTTPVEIKASKRLTIERIIGKHEGNRRNASWSFKVGSSTYHVSVPDSFIYKVPYKDIINNIDKIRAEMTDNIIRYDNYLSVLRSYFDITDTIITEEYIVLTLAIKDD